MNERIAAIEAGFLKPDHSRLAALRDLARELGSRMADPEEASVVQALYQDLAASFPEDWEESGPRSYVLTGAAASVQPDARELNVRETRCQPVSPHPPDLAAAVLFWCDPPTMRRAEELGREVARRLWAKAGLDDPPTEVVWKVSGWGSAPSSGRPNQWPVMAHLDRRPEYEKDLVVGPRTVDASPFVPAFGFHVAPLAAKELDWDEAMELGWVSSPNPYTPLLDLWGSGAGLAAINEEAIVLFMPEVPAVTRLDEATGEWVEQRRRALQGRFDHAIMRGDEEAIGRLLSEGADPNHVGPHGLRPLHRAVEWAPWQTEPDVVRAGITRMVRALLDCGADPGASDDYHHGNALFARARRADVMGCRCVLEGGFPPDAQDDRGRTALHQAVERGFVQGVERLLELGCDPNLADKDGFLPLHRAMSRGALRKVDLLWPSSDLHRTTGDGQTLYHLAVAALGDQSAPWIERIADAGVENRPDHRGWLPSDLRPQSNLPLPPPLGLASSPAEATAVAVPPKMRPAREDDASWLVLADWFQQRGDPRGWWIPGAGPESVPPTDEQRSWLHEDFSQAHALGAALADAPSTGVQWVRGVPWRLRVKELRFQHALPALLGAPSAGLLHEVRAKVDRPEPLRELLGPHVPPAVWIDLAETAPEGAWELVDGAAPALGRLAVRNRRPRVIHVRHPHLRTLILSEPYLPDEAVIHGPLGVLETPGLERLEVTFAQAPDDEEVPGVMERIRPVFHDPPPQLRDLSLRPVTPALLAAIEHTAVFEQLDTLTLLSVKESLLAYLLDHAELWAHGPRLLVKSLGTRAARDDWRVRLRDVLPQLTLEGIDYRNRGSF